MTVDLRREEVLGFVDATRGTVARRIFSDEVVYQAELEHIFARAWLFMVHESQIPNPGDFFLNYMGEDRVIVVRDKGGGINVLLNTCRHRGNAVCRAEEGHATSFMCTYHGWTYDLQGNLVGVPGFKDYYHEDLDRDEWGLVRAAKVDSYHGYVFATLDPGAPDLHEYLGQVGRLGLDIQAIQGKMQVVGGIQKYIINCNWKLAVDNVWDWYHGPITHASQMMSGYNWGRRQTGRPATGVEDTSSYAIQNVLLGDFGHAIGGPAAIGRQALQAGGGEGGWRTRAEAKEALGPVGIETGGHPHIFPTMWLTASQVSLRIPRGPLKTEIWWFTLVDADASGEQREQAVYRANHTFGPGGMAEQEDGENWGQSTRGSVGLISRRYPLNYSMNVGRGEMVEEELGLPRILTHVNEHAQLWHYRAWAAWMAADGWAELKANRPLSHGIP